MHAAVVEDRRVSARFVGALAACLVLAELATGATPRFIGKVTDFKGVTSVRPAMTSRWTPIAEGVPLQVGDWLRTDVRGANALQARLKGGAQLTLGPGSLVEAAGTGQVRLVHGEVETACPDGAGLVLLAPNGRKETISGTQVWRCRDRALAKLDHEPAWLKGFKGTAVTESLGSLVANVDGRDVPLSVGYHKVTVDVRDQIARTVIEESFVNHTRSRLEGVFYFPLPQDASISNFGMWIGGELVEADVVEKQRAREIYETILRERRDPGLLEWTGGNIFKARVFPIFAGSEKRITITYTQVLPMRGSRYRYSYALQSELLRKHPLRELALDVRVHSALPLRNVACPTHDTRLNRTEHSARVEFAAEEYTPTRDFEVEVEVDAGERPVVLIPHERGEDGYFLLLITPPDETGDWQRSLVRDGEPLELLLLVDTSASVDARQRETRNAFVAALLGALGEQDRFSLGMCDVDCAWFRDEPLPATAENVAAATDALHARRDLGWSDLDRAFSAVLDRVKPGTHVVYVGDAVPTTHESDPVAFAKRLGRMAEGCRATFHAVAPGSTFETVVLKAIAAVGGGSSRRIEGENGAQKAALELLTEITQPGLRDLQVDIRGLRTARIYPGELPNLSAGMQQILLGRYLPEGRDAKGEVVVRGVRDGRPTELRAPVTLAEAEKGNSFIPRLWARTHLDALLAQGKAPAIKDEIIALSEEYRIMTPYTSFLVLETDEDRERFGVKRRFRMRDGERFFADGREAATTQLLRQQIQRAAGWRQGLRRRALAAFAEMGRVSPSPPGAAVHGEFHAALAPGGRAYSASPPRSRSRAGVDYLRGDYNGRSAGREAEESELGAWDAEEDDVGGSAGWELSASEDLADVDAEPAAEPRPSVSALPRMEKAKELRSSIVRYGEKGQYSADGARYKLRGGSRAYDRLTRVGWDRNETSSGYLPPSAFARKPRGHGRIGAIRDWLRPFLPHLTPPPAPPVPDPTPTTWSAEAVELAKLLERPGKLSDLREAVRMEIEGAHVSTATGPDRPPSSTTIVVNPAAWLRRVRGAEGNLELEWCSDGVRGQVSTAFLLGQKRDAIDEDRTVGQSGINTPVPASFLRQYASYRATVERRTADRAVLQLEALGGRGGWGSRVTVTVDTARRIVLSRRTETGNGSGGSEQRYLDHVQAAGRWWPTLIETRDLDGNLRWSRVQRVTGLTPEQGRQAISTELQVLGRCIVVPQPPPDVVSSRRAVRRRDALPEQCLSLMTYFISAQRWERAAAVLALLEEAHAAKPGTRWVRFAFLRTARRHEELRRGVDAWADELLATPRQDELYLANQLASFVTSPFSAAEQLELWGKLRPVYERHSHRQWTTKTWRESQARLLQGAGRRREALALRRELAQEFPTDASAQLALVRALADLDEREEAYSLLERLLAQETWPAASRRQFRRRAADMLEQDGSTGKLVEVLSAAMAEAPEDQDLCSRYLSALVTAGEDERANALITEWIEAGLDADRDRPRAEQVRLNAAVSCALGQFRHYSGGHWLDKRWLPLLTRVVRHYLKTHDTGIPAERIMSQHYFRHSPAAKRLREEVMAMLTRDLAALSPTVVQQLVRWTQAGDPVVAKPGWRDLMARLRERWRQAQNEADKYALGQTVTVLLGTCGDTSEQIAFAHEQWKAAPEQTVGRYAEALLNLLLAQPWSVEVEDLCFEALPDIGRGEQPDVQEAMLAGALQHAVDRLVRARLDAAWGAVQEKEAKTRTQQRAARKQCRLSARTGMVERLDSEHDRATSLLRPWFDIERMYWRVKLGQDPEAVADACWAQLGEEAPDLAALADSPGALLVLRRLDTLGFLATRAGAAPALAERLVAYLRRAVAAQPGLGLWRERLVQLLLALDRAKELETTLESWLAGEPDEAHWRVLLGYLKAETNRLRDAVSQFETAREMDELPPAEQAVLADWYLALNELERREQARSAVWEGTDEQAMAQRLSQLRSRVERRDGSPPDELPDDTFDMLVVLMRKAQRPENHLWQVCRLYKATRDFRILQCLPEGVTGRTADSAYAVTKQLGDSLREVLDEATTDQLSEQITVVRQRVTSPSDLRMLDLVEVQVKRRAAEVLNQPGQYTDDIVAAMDRAFKGEWRDGERRHMAEFLSRLGEIRVASLAEKQLSHLRTLHRQERHGTLDRLLIAHAWGQTVGRYSRHDEAVDLLRSALEEFRNANGGALLPEANGAFATLIGFLKAQRHFVRAEALILVELERAANRNQGFWLKERLYEVYSAAISHDGEVSLGKREALLQAIFTQLPKDLQQSTPNHVIHLIQSLCNACRAAKSRKLTGVSEQLIAFADRDLPSPVRWGGQHAHQYYGMVDGLSDTMRDVCSARDALRFLIKQLEMSPPWLAGSWQSPWQRLGRRLGELRKGAGDLGELEGRLLAIVLRELRRHLESHHSSGHHLYWKHSSYFWSEKADDFARVAEEVWRERRELGRAVEHIARYLYRGLDLYSRAIEILLDAEARRILHESGRDELVNYLHWQNRHAESIPILRDLIVFRPDRIDYRTRLMVAYFHAKRPNELRTTLQEADAFFHDAARWQEQAMAALAKACLDTQLFTESVAYHDGLIMHHRLNRQPRRRRQWHERLSAYHRQLAQAHAGLGDTDKAVAAACGAIVAWGRDRVQRRHALETLKDVLRRSPDLAGFVQRLDAQVKQTRLDNPIVRKALGRVFMDTGQYPEAVVQLQLAVRAQPNDADTRNWLIECYDRQNDREGAIGQLLQLAQFAARDIGLYEQLGTRLAQAERAQDSERAYTTIVEMQANESESHTKLAEIRQKQDRWPDAMGHWRRVAEIRVLEPTGLLNLAKAQIHEKQWDAAEDTLDAMRTAQWPSRFGNTRHQTRQLQQQIERESKRR